MTDEDLKYFEKKLLDKKKELLDAINEPKQKLETDANELSDEADRATLIADQTLIEQMMLRNMKLLAEVDKALLRIREGEYGYCEGSGDEISKSRLELQPWAKYTVAYQEALERLQAKKGGRGFNDE